MWACLFGYHQDFSQRRQEKKGKKLGVTQILPFPRISEIKSFIIFFPPCKCCPLMCNGGQGSCPKWWIWSQQGGHTHTTLVCTHARAQTRAHTHTHRKAATNVPMSWSLDRRSLSEPTVLVWLFSQHSDKMLLETMWLPAVVKAKVTGVNTTQIALEIKMTCWIFLLYSNNFSSTQGIFWKLSCSCVFSDFQSHLVTACLLAVIICHSAVVWLWRSTYVSFHLQKRDQYAACCKGDEAIGGAWCLKWSPPRADNWF